MAVIDVVESIPHPDLDLMLVRLANPAVDGAGSAVPPLVLNSLPLDEHWIGTRVVLAGFGEQASFISGQLQFVNEPITSIDSQSIIVDGSGRSGACSGDSGGPLLAPDASGAPVVIGVLNGGSQSCLDQDRYVRTDVAFAWIEQQMATHSAGACAP